MASEFHTPTWPSRSAVISRPANPRSSISAGRTMSGKVTFQIPLGGDYTLQIKRPNGRVAATVKLELNAALPGACVVTVIV